jgi:hypothetical protein
MAETPAWAFSVFDWDGPWGVAALGVCDCRKHVEKHLAELERATWAIIINTTGGKAKGTNHHSIAVDELSKIARDRLEEIGRTKLEEVFSLRLESVVRVYGIREGRILKIMWVDPWHSDENKAVCPSKKRHT